MTFTKQLSTAKACSSPIVNFMPNVSTRLSLHPLTYHLDITIENERDFLPIWKIVPVVAAHVSHVRTTITAKDDRSKLEDQDYRPSKFESENGGSPPIMWSFYNLLRSFTTHNTAALTSNIHHTIGFLDIDILTPSLKPNQRFHPKGRLRSDSWRQEDGLDPMVDYVMRPDYLLTFLASEMTYLLAMTYDRSIYGSFLYESVGSIRMSLDGNPISTWDLGDKLASFPQKGPIEAFQKGRQRDWKEYYDTAIESRRKHGLPVGKANT